MDRILSGATSPGQSGLGSDGNEGVLHIPPKSLSLLPTTITITLRAIVTVYTRSIVVTLSPKYLSVCMRVLVCMCVCKSMCVRVYECVCVCV